MQSQFYQHCASEARTLAKKLKQVPPLERSGRHHNAVLKLLVAARELETIQRDLDTLSELQALAAEEAARETA